MRFTKALRRIYDGLCLTFLGRFSPSSFEPRFYTLARALPTGSGRSLLEAAMGLQNVERRDIGQRGRILVVCEGNVCRSLYIERLLDAGLHDLDVEVSSGGNGALIGRAMDGKSARLLKHAGISADHFVARQLIPQMMQAADLVLTATREIRREVIRIELKALHYTHALIDFSDLVAAADMSRPTIAEAPNANLVGKTAARALTGRDQITARVASDVEIVDPYRKRGRVFEAMARQVDDTLQRLVNAACEVVVSR